MILNHLVGIYTHPKEEWQTIDRKHESYFYALSHIAIIALIPAIVGYYASAHLGWRIGAGDVIKLTESSALTMAVSLYFGLIVGVIALAILIHELANAFEVKPTYTQSLELAAYTATPLFMVGFAALYPVLWFVMTVGLAGLSYSVYLLYSGVPILMHMPEDKGFIYSSSVVTCGLVLLVILMASSVILWSMGFGPVYMH
ncbi:YIP1 family protein [Alteromonas ponticola]|uniref:YIP1 family protein n=1 Tax=Alteromonas aquimaris TaxID=2998417 RepID=A0ABT3P883_9ALTE|nr:Yip1 family protein [Alteromonas aquimaris]MCW8108301.1 YIP1 family protein [Alteromonas aquimaris]